VIVLLRLLAMSALFVFAVLPIIFTIAGIVSCLQANKPTNTKLLWLIIIILAPFFGPLLWFLWGKENS